MKNKLTIPRGGSMIACIMCVLKMLMNGQRDAEAELFTLCIRVNGLAFMDSPRPLDEALAKLRELVDAGHKTQLLNGLGGVVPVFVTGGGRLIALDGNSIYETIQRLTDLDKCEGEEIVDLGMQLAITLKSPSLADIGAKAVVGLEREKGWRYTINVERIA